MDVIYTPLPFYHGAAGAVAMGTCLMEGLTLVTRKRFSASCYWTDCRTHGATVRRDERKTF